MLLFTYSMFTYSMFFALCQDSRFAPVLCCVRITPEGIPNSFINRNS